MPRQLRIQYPGAIDHVMNRGDRREEIFADDQDRERFLATLGQRVEKGSVITIDTESQLGHTAADAAAA